MKKLQQDLSTVAKKGITRREGLMLTLLGSALVLAGCGGGGGSTVAGGGGTGGVTGGSTGSSASGAITGFGSIIVGGVRYDDSTATSIKDDDGVTKANNELKMGMVVKIKGGKKYKDGANTKASCESIEVHSELQGPIDSKTATSFQVLGQTVEISATTYFDDGLTFARLATGNVVEVYGFIDPLTNTIAATRVELKPNANKFKLQGPISVLNTATKTFQIGSLVIAYTSAEMPANLILKVGLVVRVRLDITPLIGTRTAQKIRAAEYEHDDSAEAEVEGFITAFTSNALFSVNGLVVNTSVTTKFDYPVGTMLKVGDRVEVEGSIVNGILMAKEVELEEKEDNEDYKKDLYKFELHGLVSELDKTTKTFMLRGVLVSYIETTTALGIATYFKDGATLANLANGSKVEVKGTLVDGNRVLATQISRES